MGQKKTILYKKENGSLIRITPNEGNANTVNGTGFSNGKGSKGIISIPADGAPVEVGQYIDLHYGLRDDDYTVRLEACANGDLAMAHSSGVPGGTIHCNVDTVGGYTAEQLIQSNPNLLDNPDFRVNQRGITSSQDLNSFIVDRWRINYWHNGTPVTEASLNTDGSIDLKLLVQDPDWKWWLLAQVGEDVLKIGQSYTLSCKVRNATPSSFAIAIFGSNLTTISSSDGIYSATGYIDNLTNIHNVFGIVSMENAPVDASITVEWVKLEEGDIVTPFISPNYATELLKCQRYFERVHIVPGDTLTGIQPNFLVSRYDYKVTKRVVPTITGYPLYIVRTGYNDGVYGSSVTKTPTFEVSTDSCIMIFRDDQVAPVDIGQYAYSGSRNNEYFDVSADL